MRPAAWAFLAVQQHIGLSLHVGRVLPPRVNVRESCSSEHIGQRLVSRPEKNLRTFQWTTASAAAGTARNKRAQVWPLRVWSEDEDEWDSSGGSGGSDYSDFAAYSSLRADEDGGEEEDDIKYRDNDEGEYNLDDAFGLSSGSGGGGSGISSVDMEEEWLLGEQSTAGGGGGEEGDGDGAASLGLGPVGLDLGGVGGGGQGMEVDGVDLDLEMDADQAIDPFALAELGHVVDAAEDETDWDPVAKEKANKAASQAAAKAKRTPKKRALKGSSSTTAATTTTTTTASASSKTKKKTKKSASKITATSETAASQSEGGMAGALSVLGGSEEIEDGGLGSKGEAVGGASTRKIRKAKKGGAANKGVSVVAGLTVEVGEEAVVDGEGAAEAAAAAAAEAVQAAEAGASRAEAAAFARGLTKDQKTSAAAADMSRLRRLSAPRRLAAAGVRAGGRWADTSPVRLRQANTTVEQKLISAGLLREDGVELDEDEASGLGGVFNEVEVSDGEEACEILMERLGFDEEGITHLVAHYPPLRGELWYRREPTPGSKIGKKVLDVFYLEETLPDLLDLLLGEEEKGGVGLKPEQVRTMLTCTPSLVGVDASDAGEVAGYLRSDLGLDGRGQLASVLEACPPMLMYHAWDNLRKKVRYYCEVLDWSNEDVCSMLTTFPNFLSIKMENDVIEVIAYLRGEVGLKPALVSRMIREFPQLLEVRPKRLKAVVRYLWKVLEIPRNGVAVLLSEHPRACTLEAEANIAPLRQFFERELFVEDTARIGRLVYKFPRLLFQDVETQLVPRAEDFRKAEEGGGEGATEQDVVLAADQADLGGPIVTGEGEGKEGDEGEEKEEEGGGEEGEGVKGEKEEGDGEGKGEGGEGGGEAEGGGGGGLGAALVDRRVRIVGGGSGGRGAGGEGGRAVEGGEGVQALEGGGGMLAVVVRGGGEEGSGLPALRFEVANILGVPD
eukprot:jgi/Undpi1/5281/HiC_scaffold_2.g00562.m1